MRKLLVAFCMMVLVSLSCCINVFAITQDIRVGLFFNIKEGCVDRKYTQFTVSSSEGLQIKKYGDLSELNCGHSQDLLALDNEIPYKTGKNL